MRPSLLLIIGFLIQSSLSAQSLDSLANRFNRNLELYLAINPHEPAMPLEKTALTISEREDYQSEYAIPQDSIEAIELQAYYNYRLDSIILQLFQVPDLINYNLAAALNAHVIQTKDKRFLQISYPENSGGTYQSNIVHYYYKYPDTSVQSLYSGEGESLSLNPDGYNSMEYLGDREDTAFYFFQGGVRGCSYCFSSTVGILAASADGISELESIEVNSRDWSETIHIKEESDSSKTIYIKYEVDDLSGPCYCDGGANEGAEEEQRAKYCTYTYRYYNYHLYLVEQGCIYMDPLEKENSEDNGD